jgi:hypothetical protein
MGERIIGVLTLKPAVYREIADDTNATLTAGIIVAIVALFVGLAGGIVTAVTRELNTGQALLVGSISAIIQVIASMLGWTLGGFLNAFVATKLFNGDTDTGEMMRVFGFASIFQVIGVIPIIGGLIGAILSIIGNVIGIREAAEFTTGKAIGTALISGIIVLIFVFALTALVMSVVFIGIGIGIQTPQ